MARRARNAALVVGLLALSFIPRIVRAHVGFRSSSGYPLDSPVRIGANSWFLTRDGCFVGKAGNLVVTPMPGRNPDGSEILSTGLTGPRLCSWLETMRGAHESMRGTWERMLERKKSEVSRWNFWRSFRLWMKSFPELQIEVRTTYLDLWYKDTFGYPMPWITAEFRYVAPSESDGFGLFDHMSDAVFSMGGSKMPEQVVLLLQPRAGFNRPLHIQASNWQYLTGLAAALRDATPPDRRDVEDVWGWASDAYGRASSLFTIHGSIDEFWMNGSYCYFRALLRVEWSLFRETVCERLQREANSDMLSAVKATHVESVRIHVRGTDLFNNKRPSVVASLGEGILTTNVGSANLRIEVDTNPANQPNFERAKSTTRHMRTAGFVIRGLRHGVGSLREGEAQQEDQRPRRKGKKGKHAFEKFEDNWG